MLSSFSKVILITFFLQSTQLMAQTKVVKNIRSFGATGNGKTNDTEAFLKAAAFFNERGGNGTLLIPKGLYIIGRQIKGTEDVHTAAFGAVDILAFNHVQNLLIKGEAGSVLKYTDNLKFGCFDPVTGAIYNEFNAATTANYVAVIGNCISLTNCHDVTIKMLALDGNNKNILFGGMYGDKGIQLQHVGIFLKDSRNIAIDHINAGYFGLDGIEISNAASPVSDQILLSNTTCEYNCRQGLSWVGGNYLKAENCQFNHTGRSGYFSPPGAGVDIEAEVSSITNGIFNNCVFFDNTGCGMVTGGGNASNCKFNDCTFWGTSNWSIWVTAPAFTFTGCKIYGSIVHGYNAANASEATRFIRCYFEDKAYKGKSSYGKFLMECEGPRRIFFDSCTFVPHEKPLAWLNTTNAASPEERATISNSRFIMPKKEKDNIPVIFNSINFLNNSTEFKN